MNDCAAGHYITNVVVTRNPLVCSGGFGQPRCIYYQICLYQNGYKLSKNGRRIRVKRKD